MPVFAPNPTPIMRPTGRHRAALPGAVAGQRGQTGRAGHAAFQRISPSGPLSGYAPLRSAHRMHGLSAFGLGAFDPRARYLHGVHYLDMLASLGAIDPSLAISPPADYQTMPPAPTPPGLPAGWDTSTPAAAPPAVIGGGITNLNAGPVTIPTGTILTYSVQFNLLGISNALTDTSAAIGSITGMLAGAGLSVVSVSVPVSLNPFSGSSAVLVLQVTGAGFPNIQTAQGVCDNAIASGIGAQIVSSSLVLGQQNSALTWLSQNWQLAAAAVLGILILPKILDL